MSLLTVSRTKVEYGQWFLFSVVFVGVLFGVNLFNIGVSGICKSQSYTPGKMIRGESGGLVAGQPKTGR